MKVFNVIEQGHGTLDAIYMAVQRACEVRGWDGVDLLIIGGDFQVPSPRNPLKVADSRILAANESRQFEMPPT